jgi:hypothetical protein
MILFLLCAWVPLVRGSQIAMVSENQNISIIKDGGKANKHIPPCPFSNIVEEVERFRNVEFSQIVQFEAPSNHYDIASNPFAHSENM